VINEDLNSWIGFFFVWNLILIDFALYNLHICTHLILLNIFQSHLL